MKYKFCGKEYDGSVTLAELEKDLEKNKKIVAFLDMKKATIKTEIDLSAQELINETRKKSKNSNEININ